MTTVTVDGETYDVIWNGSHNGANDDLFRVLEEIVVRPVRLEKPSRGRVVYEVRSCLQCGAPVPITSQLTPLERETRRFCSRRCAGRSAARSSQVAA